MSPEQACGREVDARSDLFSLGVLLYEILTGRSPFRARNISETLHRVIAHHPPSAQRLNPMVPRELSNLVSVELEAGYFEADGSSVFLDKAFGVPLMVNGVLNFQVWILELYGGAGIGTIYQQLDGALGGSTNDWLFAGNAFLGTDFVLFDKLTGGVELKYYIADGNVSGVNPDALAAMFTLGWRF